MDEFYEPQDFEDITTMEVDRETSRDSALHKGPLSRCSRTSSWSYAD